MEDTVIPKSERRGKKKLQLLERTLGLGGVGIAEGERGWDLDGFVTVRPPPPPPPPLPLLPNNNDNTRH
jgi:hypothetical protein